MTDTTASINAINECLRHLVWIKSDMAAVKKSIEKAPSTDISLFGNIPKPVYEKTSFEFTKNDTAKAKD
ncbi:hypothetical protein HDV04_000991 [Boothiomyces sp. JEL0838]|nr:hypothetical protein HDV04_000991 [Boothiomyces sp. JEL0838]